MIKYLSIENFVVHDSLQITFPERLWIRGPNGAGKSLILDAITYLLWGQWRLGSKRPSGAKLRIQTDRIEVTDDGKRQVVGGPQGRDSLPYIRKAIGMDFDLARATAISRQGEHAFLLHFTPLQRLQRLAFLTVYGVDSVNRKLKARQSYLKGVLDATSTAPDLDKIRKLERLTRRTMQEVEYDESALRIGPDLRSRLEQERQNARQHFAWLLQKFVAVGEQCPICGNTVQNLVPAQPSQYRPDLLNAISRHAHRKNWSEYYQEQVLRKRYCELARHRALRIAKLKGILQTWKSQYNAAQKLTQYKQEYQDINTLIKVCDERRLFALLSEPLNQYLQERTKHLPIPLSLRIQPDGFYIEFDGKPAEVCSGGEQFLASLALRIILTELLQHFDSGIGALLIDEGFGSLNRDNLELAVSLIESTQLQVVVISHVELPVEWDVLEIGRKQ